MNMAEGTKCTPAGYTDDFNFRIEREGEDDNDENRSDESQINSASGVKLDSVVMLVVVSLLWVVLGIV